MTTIGMHYDVLPGKEKVFTDGFASVLDVMKSLPGHIESRLYEDVFRKGSYVIFSQWARKEDFDAFIHSEAFRSTVTWGKEQVLRGRPQHKIYLNQ
jgi:heme-degrading monooxygenase HmoA